MPQKNVTFFLFQVLRFVCVQFLYVKQQIELKLPRYHRLGC